MSAQVWPLPPAARQSPDGLCDGPDPTYIAAMNDLAIKVVLDPAHIGETDQYCRALSALGLTVESSFPEIGVIFGAGSAALLDQMNAMEGVAEAVVEGEMRGL
jgi:hypothetical protein